MSSRTSNLNPYLVGTWNLNPYFIGTWNLNPYLVGTAVGVGAFVAVPYVATAGLYYVGFTSSGLSTIVFLCVFFCLTRG